MYVGKVIDGCAHDWVMSNNASHKLSTLLSFLFQTMDALYCSVRIFPDVWTNTSPTTALLCGSQSMFIRFNAGPDALLMQKAAISLSGDVYCILKRIKKEKLYDLSGPVDEMLDIYEEFHQLRNFYAHLDDRLANLKVHGFSGDYVTGCGIEYRGAIECFHMVLVGNIFYYTSSGKCLKTDIGRNSFGRLIRQSLKIVEVVAKHGQYKNQKLPMDVLYKI